jgi:hypothetical protein
MKTKKRENGVQAFPLAWPHGWPRTPENARESGYQFTQTDFDSGARVPVSLTYAYGLILEEVAAQSFKCGRLVQLPF